MPRISDSTSRNLFGFRIPQAKLSRIPDFGSLHGAKRERFSKSERLSKLVLYSEPLDISRTATPRD